VRRLKGNTDSVHYLERDEVNGLKLLQWQQGADRTKGLTCSSMSVASPSAAWASGRMIERAGEVAGLPFPIHVQHAAAFDAIRTGGQGVGHTAAAALPRACLITNTVRYTAMSPEPFKDIWR
jgi:hypothetical protein